MSYIAKLREQKDITTRRDVDLSDISSIDNLDTATAYIQKLDKSICAAWVCLALTLRTVRDSKLYKERFATFDEYILNELQYKKTTAYNLLKLSETYDLMSGEYNEVGFSKLLLLSKLEQEEREEILENNNIENMSVRQLETKIVEFKAKTTPYVDVTPTPVERVEQEPVIECEATVTEEVEEIKEVVEEVIIEDTEPIRLDFQIVSDIEDITSMMDSHKKVLGKFRDSEDKEDLRHLLALYISIKRNIERLIPDITNLLTEG